jgi:hypothetical protein
MKLHDHGRERRRTIQDAIEVFRNCPGFSEDFCAEILVRQMVFPNGEAPYLIQLVSYSLGLAVSLPTASHFFAVRTVGLPPERFPAFRLDGATIDSMGNVQLTDETCLHRVSIKPARINGTPSEMDLEILHFVVDRYGDIDRGYAYLGLTDVRYDRSFLDFSTLSDIEVPALKAIEIDIRENCSKWPKLSGVTHREIGRALAKCGVRRPRSGPRSSRAIESQSCHN